MKLHPSLRAFPAPNTAGLQTPLSENPENSTARFLADFLAGLGHTPKSLPCKYLYDAEGSRLFDQICELPEYYPTRTELAILRERLPEVAELIGPATQVIEFGSGSGLKTRLLLSALRQPTGCALVEISRGYLMASADALAAEFPLLAIHTVWADYTQPFELPSSPDGTRRKLAYFPGSTIGNFEPVQARAFLARVAQLVGPGGGLLIGIDLQKDPHVLRLAYDDPAGVTAAFNRNLLVRANRELGTGFRPHDFRHHALYNQKRNRVEMHLVAQRALAFTVAGKTFEFIPGESIHTENSYKYTPEGFAALAESSGWNVAKIWTDPGGLFSVQLLSLRPGPVTPLSFGIPANHSSDNPWALH